MTRGALMMLSLGNTKEENSRVFWSRATDFLLLLLLLLQRTRGWEMRENKRKKKRK
jgi:hypothetical protein